ncbi:MAG: metalloregulator ArsR/SmtB family transcription factor [Deltaproteobacteria bacterium]|mgnify:CR=1 FL=1|nr:metalloregulator ArsR/SmtB family transcription factor [Deltaproteobacteria bacterium]
MIKKILKILADDTRLRLLGVLQGGEFTVRELTSILSLRQPLVSHHLKILLDAGLVSVKRQGTWGYYRLAKQSALFDRLWSAIEGDVGLLPEVTRDAAAVLDCLEARKKASRDFFDRHARNWDNSVHKVLPLPDYRNRLLTFLPNVSAALEVGCGTGSLLPSLAGRAPLVVGVDQSLEMIEEARKKIHREGLHGVDLRVGDMAHLPVAGRQVDLVLFNMVLHHAPHPASVLREAARVLKPSGCLVIADLLPHEKEWVRDRLADQWLGFTVEEMGGFLGQNGFIPESWEEIPGNNGQLGLFILRARKGENRNQSEAMSLFREE